MHERPTARRPGRRRRPLADASLADAADGAPAGGAEHLPPPISGGTLLITRDGRLAVASDPDADRVARRPVCAAPRGIACEEGTKLLHVACALGELVSLSPLSGAVARRLPIDVDLRDVVVVPDGLVVSRFKTAELIRVDHDGKMR